MTSGRPSTGGDRIWYASCTKNVSPDEFILVVDDDAEIRESLSDLLSDEGHRVRAAANGKEALELLRQTPAPCMILLDLMMPVMNGWQFVTRGSGRSGAVGDSGLDHHGGGRWRTRRRPA